MCRGQPVAGFPFVCPYYVLWSCVGQDSEDSSGLRLCLGGLGGAGAFTIPVLRFSIHGVRSKAPHLDPKGVVGFTGD